MENAPHFAVIMAGGTGTRLWPLSRKSHPKQFHAFTSEKTLIQETYDRLLGVIPKEHIYISTGYPYVDLVKKNLPDITDEQFILEPEARNTGPAISLAALTIAAKHPGAIIATIASDHAISNPEEFQATLHTAFASVEAKPDALVVVGINPTSPNTGFGYIKLGSEWNTLKERRVFIAESFKEKPDLTTAEEYLRSFEYLWNAGYFIFRADAIRAWLSEFAPDLLAKLESLVADQTAGKLSAEDFSRRYHELENTPFDILVAERLPQHHRLIIPAPLEWSDVGNWEAIYDFTTQGTANDSVIHGKHIGVKSQKLLIHGGKRLIVTVGLDDVVIIDTPDALLVAKRSAVATDIKQVIETLKNTDPELL